jgi:hypothetical protein
LRRENGEREREEDKREGKELSRDKRIGTEK